MQNIQTGNTSVQVHDFAVSIVYLCSAENQAFQRELAGLSERYSQKCLELNRVEQNNAEREREISRKERDMEQLRKENQVSLLRLLKKGKGRSVSTKKLAQIYRPHRSSP